jgi:hypothetical protein
MKTADTLRGSRIARAGAASDEPPAGDRPIQRLARVTGLLYLVLAVVGMLSPMVLESLVVPGDARATADGILGSRWLFGSSLVGWLAIVVLDVAISVALYLLLRPASRTLSLLAAAFRLVYSAVLAAVLLNLFDAFLLLTGTQRAAGLVEQQRQAMALASIDAFDAGFLLALVVFGVHLLTLGLLLHRSRYVPRAFGVLLVAAGMGYVVDSLLGLLVGDHGALVSVVLLAPAVLGEIGLAAWLLLRGVTPPAQARARTAATAASTSSVEVTMLGPRRR